MALYIFIPEILPGKKNRVRTFSSVTEAARKTKKRGGKVYTLGAEISPYDLKTLLEKEKQTQSPPKAEKGKKAKKGKHRALTNENILGPGDEMATKGTKLFVAVPKEMHGQQVGNQNHKLRFRRSE
jgi:hypothetical protein